MRHRKKPKVFVRHNKYLKEWEIWLVNGHQSFPFKYTGTRAECRWYRKMLKIAGVDIMERERTQQNGRSGT